MIKNYLKTFWRLVSKNKVNFFIKISGLIAGLTSVLLIFIYLQHELSYDNFHKDPQQLYRLITTFNYDGGNQEKGNLVPGRFVADIQKEFPEVEMMCRIDDPLIKKQLKYNDQIIKEQVAFTDSTFFSIFGYNLIKGIEKEVLSQPKTAVISEKVAHKLFDRNEEVIGKVIKIEDETFKITGIFENMPANSHLSYDILCSISTRSPHQMFNRGFSLVGYLRLKPHIDKQDFLNKLNDFGQEHHHKSFNIPNCETSLQSINDVHFGSTDFDINITDRTPGNKRYLYIFFVIAGFIIIIAVINFINLSIVEGEKRIKETGVRKVLGGSKQDLSRQFLAESILTTFLAILISFEFAHLLLGYFGELMDRNLSMNMEAIRFIIPISLVLTLVVGIIAGSYPAFYLSRYQTAEILKGDVKMSKSRNFLQKALVVVQFTIGSILLTSMLIMFAQIDFVKHKDLGFEHEQVVVFPNVSNKIAYEKGEETLKQIRLLTEVAEVTGSMSSPGDGMNNQSYYLKALGRESQRRTDENYIQKEFFRLYGVPIVRGENFSGSSKQKLKSCIVNEAFVRSFNLEEPLGTVISNDYHTLTIIGVVKDFNQASLYSVIEPCIYRYSDDIYTISVKMKVKDMKTGIGKIQDILQGYDEDYMAEYTFIDQIFAKMYVEDEKRNFLISSSAMLAIIISIMGLYALISFIIQRKVKEIGIRKTLGASSISIVNKLITPMITLIIVSNIIAIPITKYAMEKWLQEFAYHISLGPKYFIISGIITVLIAVITAGSKAWIASNENPIDAIKIE